LCPRNLKYSFLPAFEETGDITPVPENPEKPEDTPCRYPEYREPENSEIDRQEYSGAD
jgi:hypothetical protein